MLIRNTVLTYLGDGPLLRKEVLCTQRGEVSDGIGRTRSPTREDLWLVTGRMAREG